MLYCHVTQNATSFMRAGTLKHHFLRVCSEVPGGEKVSGGKAAVLSGNCPDAADHLADELPRGSGARLTGQSQTGLMARPINGLASHGITTAPKRNCMSVVTAYRSRVDHPMDVAAAR